MDIDETLPEVVKEFLRAGGKLERICLHATGRWTHRGQPFENERVIRLFSKSVKRTEGGTWILHIGRFIYPIEVEDVGFFVERVELDQASNQATITLSDLSQETLDPTTLSYDTPGHLYCTIKGGEHRARFLRQAYYALAEHVELDEREHLILTLGDARIDLGLDTEQP